MSGAAALAVAALVSAAGSEADASLPSAASVTGTPTTTQTATPTATSTATSTAQPTAPTPTDVGPSPLLPNLRSRLASDVHIVERGEGRRLWFGSALADVGVGPLEVHRRPGARCPQGQQGVDQAIYQDRDGNGRFGRSKDVARVFRASGCEHVTPGEDRWHVDAAARYWLTRAGHRTVIARRPKVSFCLRDSARLPSATAPAFYLACSQDGRKGISVGWSDLYESFLPGQSLRLPKRVGGHTYCLWQQADPLDIFRESNEADNTSVRAIRITLHNHVRYLAGNQRCA
jgi:Lysyl oxidase